MSSSSPRHFHRRYTQPIRGVVLESSDGVCFYFDLYLLAKHSSFFRDLLDLPQASGHGGQPIELSNTNSTALVLVLELIQRIEQALTPALVDNILELADMWDLPIAYDLLKYRWNPYTCYILNVISGDAAPVRTLINRLVTRSAECLLYDADWLDVIRNRCPEGYALLSRALWLWDVAFYIFKVELLFNLILVKAKTIEEAADALMLMAGKADDGCTCPHAGPLFRFRPWPRRLSNAEHGQDDIATWFLTFPAKVWTTSSCTDCRTSFQEYAGLFVERKGARFVLSLKRRYGCFWKLEPHWDAIMNLYKVFRLDVSTYDERHPLVVCRFK